MIGVFVTNNVFGVMNESELSHGFGGTGRERDIEIHEVNRGSILNQLRVVKSDRTVSIRRKIRDTNQCRELRTDRVVHIRPRVVLIDLVLH